MGTPVGGGAPADPAGAPTTLDSSEWWLVGTQQDALASKYARRIADDSVIVDTVGRSARESCLRCLAGNISHPGEPVSAGVTTAEFLAVRNMVSRGLDELALMDSYRLAQNAALRYWMPVAFQVTSDPGRLREVLDVGQRSIASFIESVVVQLCEMIRDERGQLRRGTDPAVRDIVTQIIDGEPPPANAEDRLDTNSTNTTPRPCSGVIAATAAMCKVPIWIASRGR